jgi:hypothetical protein
LATVGLLATVSATYARPSRAFHETIALAGGLGFGCAIVTHFVEGYTNPLHLAPVFAGAGLFAASLGLEIVGSSNRRSRGRVTAHRSEAT